MTVLELQKRLPKARIVYASATGVLMAASVGHTCVLFTTLRDFSQLANISFFHMLFGLLEMQDFRDVFILC